MDRPFRRWYLEMDIWYGVLVTVCDIARGLSKIIIRAARHRVRTWYSGCYWATASDLWKEAKRREAGGGGGS